MQTAIPTMKQTVVQNIHKQGVTRSYLRSSRHPCKHLVEQADKVKHSIAKKNHLFWYLAPMDELKVWLE